VINNEHADTALDEFMKLHLPIIDKHAPVEAPWIDDRPLPSLQPLNLYVLTMTVYNLK
jgi:hypothetical protein